MSNVSWYLLDDFFCVFVELETLDKSKPKKIKFQHLATRLKNSANSVLLRNKQRTGGVTLLAEESQKCGTQFFHKTLSFRGN